MRPRSRRPSHADVDWPLYVEDELVRLERSLREVVLLFRVLIVLVAGNFAGHLLDWLDAVG